MERTFNENEVLDIAIDIASNLLKSGAEISRVEDTISYICKAYGAKYVDCYAIPNLIVATIGDSDTSYSSKIKRNYQINNDLYLIEEFNQLSRDICRDKPELSEVRERIKEIKARKIYPIWIRFISAMMAAFGCSFFFGGTFLDALSASVVGLFVYALLQIKLLDKHKVLYILTSSLLGGLLSVLFVTIHFGTNIGFVMIGGVMIMIPGISIGTSLKDIIYGDVVSGLTRLIQAVSASLAIAAGFSIWSRVFSINIAFNHTNSVWLTIIGAPFASIGYAILFNAKPNKLFHCLIGGVTASFIYLLFTDIIVISKTNPFMPVFLGVLVGASFSEIMARIIKAPAIVMMLPSIIVLVPGSALFFMMSNVVIYNSEQFNYHAMKLVAASLAIALGIIASQIIPILIKSSISKFKKRR